MEVNVTRWGAPSTWVDYNTNAEIKRPSNAKNSYAMAYNLGSTPDESMHTDIDLSIAPWGINKNSLLNKRYYIAPYETDSAEDIVDLIPINEDELTKNKPLILNGTDRIVTAGGSSFSSDTIQDGNAKLLNNYNPNYPQFSSITTYTNWAVNNVICNFNYHKIIMLPLIVTSPGSEVNDNNIFDINTYLSGMFYTFDEFIANYDSQIKGKKVVKGFMVIEYLGNNGNRSKNVFNNIQYTIPYKVPARPSFPDMDDNNKRFPTVNIDTMVSSSTWSDGSYQGHGTGFPNVRHADWLRWFSDYHDSPEKSINYWSGANYGGTNTAWRTTCFDDEIFEYYYQPYISGQNRQGIALIRTEDKTATEIVNYFAKQAAYLGFMFAWNETDALTGIIGENNSICIPTFDGGVTTGNYTRGTENINNPAFLWRDDVYEKNNYDPNKQQRDENDKGELSNLGGFRKFPTSLTLYALSQTKFESLLQALNNLYITDPDGNAKWELDFKGSNPSDYIVAAYATLCDIGLTNTTYPIKIGPVNLADIDPNMDTYKVSFADSGYFDCGSIDIEPEFRDFRDYAPYTQIEVYLPLCGTVDVDPAYFMGHSMSITYWYDVSTMSCSACIYRDGITLYKVVNGSLGAEIPLTSLRMGDYQNSIHALEQAQKQNEMRMASAMVSMGISAAGMLAAPATGGASLGLTALGLSGLKSGIETVNAMDDIQYQMTHTQPAISQTSASESQNAFCAGGVYPKVYIKRAKTLESFDPDIYGHTVGYACNVNAYIGDMQGYTVATNIDTSGINATVDEINAIKQAFSKGVYL